MKRFALLLSALALIPLGLATAAPEAGSQAPDFALPGSDGATHSLSEYKGKYVILEWTNPQCPFVRKHYSSGNMESLQKMAKEKGAVWLTIDSSAPGKEGYLTADAANSWGKEKGADWTAFLMDPDGKVGHEYGAKATPTMVIINPEGKLLYEGAIDSIPSADPSDITKADNYVKTGLEEALSGKPLTVTSTKAYGCSVKYAN